MYTYIGYNPNSQTKSERKYFEDDYIAIEYANDNADQCPKFKVINGENEIIYSNIIADRTEQEIWDMLLPSEQDKGNFDVNSFFEE